LDRPVMTPGFAKPRSELPWLPYPESDRVFVINSHNFTPSVNLKANLVWWWDLSSADATITDQHSGLALARVGTTTTDATGGPDGGPCISVGAAVGKYRNASVAKTISYDDGYTVNIWVRSTASSPTFNVVASHRNASAPFYYQIHTRSTLAGFTGDLVSTADNAGTFRVANVSQLALNTWQMLTLRDTGTVTELYRDGSLVATSSTSLSTRSTAAASFGIGGDSWNPGVQPGTNHRGQIAMAGVWNEPLDTAAITALYNAGAGRRYATL
jgi:hypothetical protein